MRLFARGAGRRLLASSNTLANKQARLLPRCWSACKALVLALLLFYTVIYAAMHGWLVSAISITVDA